MRWATNKDRWKFYSTASYDYISNLVDAILEAGDISEYLLKRISRILAARWRIKHVSYKRGIEKTL